MRPSLLFDAASLRAVAAFVRGLFPLDLSASFLRVVGVALARTVAIAVAGTLLSIAAAIPLGALATGTLFRRGPLIDAEPRNVRFVLLALASRGSRLLLAGLRSIPELMWGILFVVAVGLGPLAGTLALAVAYAGVLGRVYADVLEEVAPGPVEALYAAGASRMQLLLRALLPQARNTLVAYTLYTFECCVRAASVLGFIGAGGIGYEIALSMRMFEYGQVLTLLLAFLFLVAATDALSRFVRRRLGANAPVGSLAHDRLGDPARAAQRGSRVWLLLAGGLVVASFVESGFVDGRLFDPRLAGRVARVVREMIPPDVSREFLRSLWIPLLQTIGISVIGTAIGVALGALLALPASTTLMLPQDDSARRASLVEHLGRRLAYGLARMLLVLLRSIPELVWVLLCMIAVGIGPFAGTLAIGLHTAGVLGKLYAETIEEVPSGPVEAVRSTGAGALQLALYAIWPQARATLVAYTVLRWEMNLRVSTVLGLVGGGGLGTAIYNFVQLGFYARVSTLALIVFALVLATEWLGDRLRATTSPGVQRRRRRPVPA
ncbi:MAG: phosphonate ABC transporter, permease protein PhnE [Polyangiales bacterium]